MTEEECTQLRSLIDRAKRLEAQGFDSFGGGHSICEEAELIRDLAAYNPTALTARAATPVAGGDFHRDARLRDRTAANPMSEEERLRWEQLLERQRRQVRNDATDALELIRSSTVFERRGRVCGLAYDSWYLTVLPDAEWLAIWLDVASGQQYVCSVLRSQFRTFLPKGETP